MITGTSQADVAVLVSTLPLLSSGLNSFPF